MSKKTAPKKKNRKLLVQMAIVLISLFVLATLAVSNMVITSSFSTCLMNIEYNCENVLRSFETLSGTMGCSSALVRFWIDHKEDITSYLSTSPDEIDYVFDLINSRFGKYDYTDMTSKEFQSLSEEDQLQIAQVAFYLESMSFSRQLSTRGVDNIQMIYEDEATGEHLKIFDSIDPEINYHPGETVDMEKLSKDLRRSSKVTKGDSNFGLIAPSPSNSYVFRIPSTYGDAADSLSYLCTVTGQEVYESMSFVGRIRNRMILFLLGVLGIILIVLYQIVTKPLPKIKKSVQAYQTDKDGTKVVEQLSEIHSHNEIGVFADVFSDLALEMDRYLDETAKLAGEKERVSTELHIAGSIQSGMLPKPLPRQAAFSLSASMSPAQYVGGDFYDYYFIDDDHLAMTIADVSGKGIPAALFMAVSKIILNRTALSGGTPARILAQANDQLCENNTGSLFVTVWLGILTLSTGELICANAGHENPALRLSDDGFRLSHTKHGLALGAMPGMKYRDETFRLAPGDALFVFTDGVPEANDAASAGEKDVKEAFFSEERLESVLRALPSDCSTDGILKAVTDAVHDFVGDAPQFDDMTMLALIYDGKEIRGGSEAPGGEKTSDGKKASDGKEAVL